MRPNSLTALEKLTKARIQLQTEHPFFSYLLMNLHFRDVTASNAGPALATMGIDARETIHYNPKFVDGLLDEELKAVLCHEVMHQVLGHIPRAQRFTDRLKGDPHESAHHSLMNVAMDAVINATLEANGFRLPDGAIKLIDGRLYFGGATVDDVGEKHWELVYEELLAQLRNDLDDLDYAFDEIIPGSDMLDASTEEGRKFIEKWKDLIANAACIAKQRGMLPAGMGALIDNLLEPKVNWRVRLQRFMERWVARDFTYARFHRKSVAVGVYLPSILKENIEMVVHVDTSASTTGLQHEFCAEISSILKAFDNIDMDWILCDMEIQRVERFSHQDALSQTLREISGYGGTSHEPVVDWVLEHKPGCRLLISLTDGYSDIKETFCRLPKTCSRLLVMPEQSRSEGEEIGYDEVDEFIYIPAEMERD